MKNRLLLISMLFVIAFFAAWTLRPAKAADAPWTTYTNERFGYSIELPDIFPDVREPDNSDGVWMQSDDENYRLTISGGYNVLEYEGKDMLKNRLEEVAHIVPDSDKSGEGWYRLIYSDDGGRDGNEHLFHEYGVVNKENWASFTLVYPKEEEARFSATAQRMEESLSLPK